jgi:hypothetical protein
MTDKIFERWYPIICSFLLALLYGALFGETFYSLPIRDVLSSVLSVAGIIIGFVATAMSILFTIEKKQIILQLKDVEYYRMLIDYFASSIRWTFMLMLLSCIGLVGNYNQPAFWQAAGFNVWLWVLLTTGFSCYRLLEIFAKILRF